MNCIEKNKMIYYFAAGSLHNLDSSVDGVKFIRLPLMTELLKRGCHIRWVGFDRNNNIKNHYLSAIGLDERDFIIDLRGRIPNWAPLFMNHCQDGLNDAVVDKTIAAEPGSLFVELRPNVTKEGYSFEKEWAVQIALINKFVDNDLPVFVWDQDIWRDFIPKELRGKITLLCPHTQKCPDDFTDQCEFFYGWTKFDSRLESRLIDLADKKVFDVCYCGNVYNRRDEFKEFLTRFHDNNKAVCIQGNWLRSKYGDRDFSLDNFPNFMFFGEAPHWAALPSIALSKSVIQLSYPRQQEIGLVTSRVFETLMGKSVVFCSDRILGIDRFVPEELIFSSPEDLFEKWENFDRNCNWKHARNIFESKLMTDENSYSARADHLLELIDERI